MAKIIRFAGYFVDASGAYKASDIKDDLNDWYYHVEQLRVEESSSFNPDDYPETMEHNCDLAELERHFVRKRDE